MLVDDFAGHSPDILRDFNQATSGDHCSAQALQKSVVPTAAASLHPLVAVVAIDSPNAASKNMKTRLRHGASSSVKFQSSAIKPSGRKVSLKVGNIYNKYLSISSHYYYFLAFSKKVAPNLRSDLPTA